MAAPATFYPNVTPGTRYWRCEVPGRRLGAKIADPHHLIRLPSLEAIGHEGDVAVWQHVGQAEALGAMAKQKLAGIRVLIDVDDNYLHRPAGRIPNFWSAESYRLHLEAIEVADGVLCSSKPLADAYRKHLGDRTRVFWCPNCVEPDDYPDPMAEAKTDTLVVGFAGSLSHRDDLKQVRRALEWAAKQENVEVLLIGCDRDDFRFPHRYVEGQPLAEYRRTLTQLRVGLAPLIEDPWTRCKTNIKALEYAMAGAVPLVAKGAVFADWQAAGWPTYYRPREWLAGLSELVNDRTLLARLARLARDYTLHAWHVERHLWRWQQALHL